MAADEKILVWFYRYDGVWCNRITGKTVPHNHFKPNDIRLKRTTTQEKINKAKQNRREEEYLESKKQKEKQTIYFKASNGDIITCLLQGKDNPQVAVWRPVEGQDVLYSKRWYNLKDESEPLSDVEFENQCSNGVIKDRHITIPLSEVVYPRLSADQIIHRNPYGGNAQKYSPTGHKVPSNFWTVFPGATPALFVLGLVALPMENGIPVVIGLFIFWCIGMYKNAEYKSFWEKENKRQEDIRVQKISRMQSKKKR